MWLVNLENVSILLLILWLSSLKKASPVWSLPQACPPFLQPSAHFHAPYSSFYDSIGLSLKQASSNLLRSTSSSTLPLDASFWNTVLCGLLSYFKWLPLPTTKHWSSILSIKTFYNLVPTIFLIFSHLL